ncbi:O-acyltransferase like protein-like [Condylostylus longicornis]|uniref:O-acyltransferase like protein-like n=1 Tax=Condylostylus longicornis TaxID=2530218 RepID=UPI00244DCEE4|nr:O-acyltransferase like protein-like [Condylostylus longicornis]
MAISFDKIIAQPTYQGFYYVDAFFVIRLVPVAILAVLLSDIVYDYLDKSSPYYMNMTNDLYCKDWAASGIVTIGKFFFGIFIGSMIIMCQKGYGGMFAELLNSRIAIHCGKLSFTMYMTSSIWITLFYSLKSYGNHFDEIETILGTYIDYEVDDELDSKNYVIGIVQIGAKIENNNTKCGEELNQLLNGINNREFWALKLINSFGIIPKSIQWGNYYWFPSREICDDLNEPYKISLSSGLPALMNVTSPIKMKFSMLYYNFTTPYYVDLNLAFEQTIHVGVCLPVSCSMKKINQFSTAYFSRQTFQPQKDLNLKMNFLASKTPSLKWKFVLNIGVIIFLTLLSTVLIFGFLAEIVLRMREKRAQLMKNNCDDHLVQEKSSFEDFLLCFDLRDNFNRALKLDDSKHFISVIAGLRTIVCLWVTLFHVYYYSLFAISNVPQLFSKLENFNLQPVIQSCFYVDVFFVISGFLLVNNFLSNSFYTNLVKNNSFWQNVKFFLKLVLNRYLRLMPMIILAMVFAEIFFELLDVFSPFRMDPNIGINCRETWWYNILLINNFMDLKYICTSWSWYLGCEMQFFIFFQIIIFVYIKHEKLGKSIFAISAISLVLISFWCNFYNGITFQIDVSNSTLEALYVKPWVRVNPYFGGALMGWALYKTNNKGGAKISFPTLTVFWLTAVVIYLITIFMTYFRNTPSIIVAIIMSFGKMIFGIFIGTIIYLCQQGYGGIFNNMMSSKIFLFMNKFCYSIYMIAPLLIYGVFGTRTEATLFSEMGSFTDLLGINVLSIAASFIAVVLWETPFMKISNRFVLPRRK